MKKLTYSLCLKWDFWKMRKIKKHFPEIYDEIQKIDAPSDNEKLFIYFNGFSTCSCGAKSSFNNFRDGYNKFCSVKCSSNSEETKSKRKQTNLKKYKNEFPQKTEEVKAKQAKTNKQRYGSKSSFQNIEVIEKHKNNLKQKYGVENPFQIKEVKEKIKRTNLEKYNVENPMQHESVKEKIKQTNLEKYGVQNTFQHESVKEKIKQTNLEKFGHTCARCNPNINKKIKKTRDKKLYARIKDLKISNCRLKTSEEEFDGINDKTLWMCESCNNTFNTNANRLSNICCPVCNTKTKSRPEDELYDFLLSLVDKSKIKRNDRSIIKPLELDFYIKEKDIAIEFDGIYWHSELLGKGSKYHLNKTLECEKKGIQLIHIFENEWLLKKDIIKSIIRSKLGLIPNKIYARKCLIKKLSFTETKLFLEDNHIQGAINSNLNYGLIHKNEILALMTFGKSRFNKKYQYELLRFCNKRNYNVVGGASRLFKSFLVDKKPTSIVSYADRRFSNGNMYSKLKFEFVRDTKPSYFYINGIILENRINYQKHKLNNILENFDPNLTEWENMKKHKRNRIWDCGNKVFGMELVDI